MQNYFNRVREMKKVSEELRLGRLRRRLSQTDVASVLGFSPATLCRIERGEKPPTAEEAHAIAKVLSAFPEADEDNLGEESILKLAENRKRLRIEIGLEEIVANIGLSKRDVLSTEPGKRSATVVFYVELDKLDDSQIQESETLDSEVSKYERSR